MWVVDIAAVTATLAVICLILHAATAFLCRRLGWHSAAARSALFGAFPSAYAALLIFAMMGTRLDEIWIMLIPVASTWGVFFAAAYFGIRSARRWSAGNYTIVVEAALSAITLFPFFFLSKHRTAAAFNSIMSLFLG